MNTVYGFAWVIVTLLMMALALYYMPSLREGFIDDGSVPPTTRDGWDLASHTELENAHGSAPAGVHALSGADQREENREAPHVSAIKGGNPQNVWPVFKAQP